MLKEEFMLFVYSVLLTQNVQKLLWFLFYPINLLTSEMKLSAWQLVSRQDLWSYVHLLSSLFVVYKGSRISLDEYTVSVKAHIRCIESIYTVDHNVPASIWL